MKHAILAAIFSFSFASPVLAHSDGEMTYPIECCHQMDCAPVDKVEIVPSTKFAAAGMGYAPKLGLPAQTIVTTKHGTAVVPEDLPAKSRYESKDGRMHACIRHTATGLKVICVFYPPGI